MTTASIGGYSAHENGFLSGISVVSYQQLAANTAMSFRVYRDGVATTCLYTITDADNKTNPDTTAGGCVRDRKFNVHPTMVNRYNSDQQVFPFKTGERITVQTETVNLPGYTDAANMLQGLLILWLNFDIITPSALDSQGVSSGSPAGGGDGGDGGGGGGVLG